MSIEVDWFLRAHPRITMVEALLADTNGVLRGKWLPVGKLEKIFQGDLKFPKSALNLDIWGRDVEELVFASGDEDGICYPVEGSLLPTPWSPDKRHGQLMLTMFRPNGEAYLGDPRQALKHVLSRFRTRGWTPVVAAELEFSLVHWDGQRPSHSCPAQLDGHPLGGNLYGLDVLNAHQPMLEAMRVACEQQDLPFDGVIKESAPSQYEINMQHVPSAVLAARQVLMMKRLIKGVAARHGLIASFMPKPFEGEAGNGLHIHCSVLDRDGRNIFDDGSTEGSEWLHYALGGCLRFMAESFLVFAPSFNGYRRFQRGTHAPTAPAWGYENRTVALRVPAGRNRARRIEHRVAGADANPYLILAVVLAAIIDGIEQRLPAGPPVAGDGYAREAEGLPTFMPEALQCFRESDFIERALGAELKKNFALTKEQEIREFQRHITTMEYQAYLEKL